MNDRDKDEIRLALAAMLAASAVILTLIAFKAMRGW